MSGMDICLDSRELVGRLYVYTPQSGAEQDDVRCKRRARFGPFFGRTMYVNAFLLSCQSMMDVVWYGF